MILVVRLGAMGDILHALPAVRALKLGHPETPLAWVVEPKWAPLLEHNPFVDRVLLLRRDSFRGLAASYRALRESSYLFAVDFQGLLKSALVAVAAQPGRIYGFDSSLQPINVKDIRVDLTLQLPAENRPSHLVFQYVAAAGQQDYLMAAFDTKQLHDKETPMTLELSNLPDRQQPKASFTPVFTPERIRPYVAQVLLRKVDAPAVLRQRICPVSGDVLGSRGRVVKVLIGDYPLYLCGEECLPAVAQEPQKFLPPPPQPPEKR